jgi:hypothetical protein
MNYSRVKNSRRSKRLSRRAEKKDKKLDEMREARSTDYKKMSRLKEAGRRLRSKAGKGFTYVMEKKSGKTKEISYRRGKRFMDKTEKLARKGKEGVEYLNTGSIYSHSKRKGKTVRRIINTKGARNRYIPK